MHRRHFRRVLVAAGLSASMLLAACGGGGEPTIEIRGAGTSTTFVTLPPPSSTTTPPATTAAPADDNAQGSDGEPAEEEPADEPADPVDPTTGNRLYTVQPNDYLLKIANKFDTTPQAIADANGWASINHNINPRDEIQIPPAEGADATAGSAGSEPAEADTASSAPSGAACEDGSERETYKIQRGDIPARVAQQFEVTVAELREANADTPNYAGFVIGLEINIPC